MTVRRRRNSDGVFVVYGPAGVISWNPDWRPDIPGPVEFHSPRSRNSGDVAAAGCPYLEMPCFHDAEFLLGDGLFALWERHQRDEQVVWPVLEDCYHRGLAGGGLS